MRMIILSAVFALGVGLAGTTGASAAPASTGLSNLLSSSALSQSLVDDVQYRGGDRYRGRSSRARRSCRQVRVCNRGRSGRVRCSIQTVCRR
ncbi:MAG: hypothetical protein Q8M26_00365 [Pseudolabrys sp.]|nr:hypothetical protein [Pseudolabrys sp.]